MKVLFSEEARSDLLRIGNYIAKDNPVRALRFVRELRSQAFKLKLMPRAFPVLARYQSSGLRRRVFRNYLIFYKIEPEQIVIVSILHGAQDYEAVLSPDA